MAAAADVPVAVDKHGRPVTGYGQACAFLVRGTRPCRNRAADGKQYCVDHERLLRQREATGGATAGPSSRGEKSACITGVGDGAPAGIRLAESGVRGISSLADEAACEAAAAATDTASNHSSDSEDEPYRLQGLRLPSRISSDQKRMKNPLSKAFAALPPPLDLAAVFDDPTLPLCLDIGCARGALVLAQAERNPAYNWIGIEIRAPLAAAANIVAARRLPRRNAHFIGCRCDAQSLAALQLPRGRVAGVTILFPDPWVRRRHQRRLTVQVPLLQALAAVMAPGAPLLLVSDCEAVLRDGRAKAAQAPFRLLGRTEPAAAPGPGAAAGWPRTAGGPVDAQGYLLHNPLAPEHSERERVCAMLWRRVYRLLWARTDDGIDSGGGGGGGRPAS